MRMAMSCLTFPDFGLPTRRARRSSWSVDSGISEKLILLSGIGFAFFTGRLARADDTNRFLAILQPPVRINDDEYSSSD